MKTYKGNIIIYGSEQSLSYQKPINLIGRLTRRLFQRQDRDLLQQLQDGIRAFDLTVTFDRDGGLVICNGLAIFPEYLSTVFETIHGYGRLTEEAMYVRIRLRSSLLGHSQQSLTKFRDYVSRIRKLYEDHITIFEASPDRWELKQYVHRLHVIDLPYTPLTLCDYLDGPRMRLQFQRSVPLHEDCIVYRDFV